MKKQKQVKRYTRNFNLAKIEAWLRQESLQGWKLVRVKESFFKNTYYFVKANSSDDLYVCPPSFAKQPKYTNTVLAVHRYLKMTYGGKRVSKQDKNLWMRLPQSETMDLADVKRNLLCREKCIAKDYLQHAIFMGVCGLGFLLICLLSHTVLALVGWILLCALWSGISLVKFLLHYFYCKKFYDEFQEQRETVV